MGFEGLVGLARILATALSVPALLGLSLSAPPWVRKAGALVSSAGSPGAVGLWLWPASPEATCYHLGLLGTWTRAAGTVEGAAAGGWGSLTSPHSLQLRQGNACERE